MNFQDIIFKIKSMPESQLIALGAIALGIVLILVAIILM